jgi:hypothetical protein
MRPKAFRSLALECVHLAQKSEDLERRSLLIDMAYCWADLASSAERFLRSVETAVANRPLEGAPLSGDTNDGRRPRDGLEDVILRFERSKGTPKSTEGVLESGHYPRKSRAV